MKSPVWLEVASENVRDGATADPSSIFIFALSIDESAPLTVIPPLKVPLPVNAEVEFIARVPVADILAVVVT